MINPNFAHTPAPGVVSITTANTARDGTGTLATVYTVPATYTFNPSPFVNASSGAWVAPTATVANVVTSGWRCDRVRVKSTGTTIVGSLLIHVHNGTTAFPIAELPIEVVTPTNGTTNSWERVIEFGGLVLPTGWSLRANVTAINASTAITLLAEGGLF